MSLRFRVRTPDGSQRVLHTIADSMTIAQLQQLIVDNCKLSTTAPCVQLKFIFPPPRIISSKRYVSLKSLQISSGNLIVNITDPPPPEPEPKPEPKEEQKQSSASQPSANSNNNSNSNASSSSSSKIKTIVKKEIAADNSCLFNAVSFVCDAGNLDKTTELRQMIASIVLSDPARFSAGLLGKSNEEYILYIMKPNTWGGYIELQILSELYQMQINAIDVVTLQIHKFGESLHFSKCVFVIYNGIHYDALVGQTVTDETQYTFDCNDDAAYALALSVAADLNAKKQFTDVHNFTLQCSVCGEKLRGQNEASQHASKTTHCQFQEYHG